MSSENLSSEQRAFLEKCNLDFADRYTDSDLEFKKIYDSEIPPPPIVCPWYDRSKQSYRNRGHGSRSRDYERDSYGSGDRYRSNY